MNVLHLAWKNLAHQPLRALLSILLLALSVGLVSLLTNVRTQADEQFDRNLAGIDLVVGAKGSPLELVLNSMYQVGYPTGNVTLGEVKAFFNPKHPIVADAVPLSAGDAYRGYRIVGTTPKLLDWYGATVAEGAVWAEDFAVTIGSEVAAKTGLRVGDTFRSSHGIIDEGDEGIEHEDDFRVVGILAKSGTVMDQVILTTNQSYWHTHDHSDEGVGAAAGAEESEDGAGGDHAGHDHSHDSEPTSRAHHDHDHSSAATLLEEDPDKEITALLVRYRNKSSFQALSFPRNLNENTGLLAANPAYEINEVRRQFDGGQRMLGLLAGVITLVSAFSVFIALYTSLRERRYELALLRSLGAGRGKLFGLILIEALLIAVLGYALGIALSHGVLALLAGNVDEEFRYQLDAGRFFAPEFWLLAGALGLAALAAFVPALRAARTDIGETLIGGK